MAHVFDRLDLKDQREVVVSNAPMSFEPEMAWRVGRRVVCDVREVDVVGFALAFAFVRIELDNPATALAAKAEGDAVLWFAYPKRTPKRYKTDFDRDHGWEMLRAVGLEPVRRVAIDADWSALRFRRSDDLRRGR